MTRVTWLDAGVQSGAQSPARAALDAAMAEAKAFAPRQKAMSEKLAAAGITMPAGN
jgi:hypothetical protein